MADDPASVGSPPPRPVSLADQVAAVRREIKMRERTFPRWVATARMSQDVADRELAAMRAVLQTLLPLVPAEAQGKLMLL
jgi:hypothetical protein